MDIPNYQFGLYFPIVLDNGAPVNPGLSDSIDSSIRNILAFSYTKRSFRYTFGTILETLLGDPFTQALLVAMEHFLEEAIKKWELRIILKTLVLTPDYENNTLTIDITASVKDREEPYQYSSLL